MLDFEKSRRLMVDNQLRTFDVTDRGVLAAVDTVPREAFVAPGQEPLAYTDANLPLGEGGRVLLQPMVLGRMIQLLAPQVGRNCLVIGGGTGYGAGLLASMGCQVTLLEEADLAADATQRLGKLGAAGVEVVSGPLDAGWPQAAPYDAILIEGAFEVLPDTIVEQLTEDGRLVGIDAAVGAPTAALFTRSGRSTGLRAPFDAAAPVLPGFRRAATFTF